MDMENEVMQFQTIILMLMKIERVNVEMILEWLERYSNIFREPISKCVNNYESGGWEALEELNDEQYARVFRAISKFALDGKEIKLSGVEKVIFQLVKPQLIANQKRYENGCKGGRRSNDIVLENNQNETEIKPNDNQKTTKTKPNDNDLNNKKEKDIYSKQSVKIFKAYI